YVENFSNYNAAYGSIAGVIVLMLWLYLTGVVMLLGGEINARIEEAAASLRSSRVRVPQVSPAGTDS
ncbi:MAG: YihY/virulence factor BrkB family protein, partial [Nitrospira sp.]|nr:YihY/virulence factor BrkB family protein [Nitrospira sp.]